MSLLGQVHLASAIASLGSGAVVLLMSPKGTRRHRQVGWTYAVSMLTLNVTALMIYRLFGGFGPFHVAALVSLAGLAVGVFSAIRAKASRLDRDLPARHKWVERHYHFMSWSYVGLWAAAVSEVATRVPAFRPSAAQGMAVFGIVVAVATLLVVGVGARLIRVRARGALAGAGVRA
jgi:uncharacterized membrane protein